MNSLHTNAEIYYFTTAILVASFGFIFYLYFSESANNVKRLKSSKGEPGYILFQRFLGVLIFGIVPVCVILFKGTKNLDDFGIITPVPETYIWTSFLSVIVISINYFNSQTPENLEMYPQIRRNEWSLTLIILSAISWMIYLLSYEFLFRGFLFFASVHLIGLWPAIIINTAIYSLVHLPKGIKETTGAIPLGILLCYLTFKTGSIWVAVFTHIIMALSNEWLSIRANPQISFKTSRK